MEYSLVTKDNEVTDINLVQVREGTRITDPILTLSYLNTHLNSLTAQASNLNTTIVGVKTKIGEIQKLAQTVKLKIIEVIPVLEAKI